MFNKDVHRSIAESISRLLYGKDEEEGIEEKEAFMKSYRAAHKTGIEELVQFILAQGKQLIEQDPNSKYLSNKDYYLYLQCIGIYLLETKEEVKEGIANNVINQLKTDLKDHSVLYIKMYMLLI